jgi:RNA polymerase sigma factor (sigma-70 family)
MASPRDNEPVFEIFEKPGCCWSDEERRLIRNWMTEDGRYEKLCKIGVRVCGGQEGRGAVEAFFADGLESVITKYDPTRAPFWPYCQDWFRWFCREQRRRRGKIEGREVSLTEKEGPEGKLIAIEIVDPGATGPEEELQRKEKAHLIQNVLNKLSEDYRSVLVMRFLEAKSIQETADTLHISPELVKTRQHRGLLRCKELLGEKQ